MYFSQIKIRANSLGKIAALRQPSVRHNCTLFFLSSARAISVIWFPILISPKLSLDVLQAIQCLIYADMLFAALLNKLRRFRFCPFFLLLGTIKQKSVSCTQTRWNSNPDFASNPVFKVILQVTATVQCSTGTCFVSDEGFCCLLLWCQFSFDILLRVVAKSACNFAK